MTTDATIKDLATLSAVLGVVTERTTGGWNRKTLTDVEMATFTTDNALDRQTSAVPTFNWVLTAAPNVTDLLICYDNDTTAGTDANIVFLTMHDFVSSLGTGTETVDPSTFFRAS